MCRCRPAGCLSGILGVVQGIFFLKFGLLLGMLFEKNVELIICMYGDCDCVGSLVHSIK